MWFAQFYERDGCVAPDFGDPSEDHTPNLELDLEAIRPANAPRLSDTVADQIQQLIISQNLAVGARLPAERDLAERLGASRPTVSQALRKLALMGLVEIRRGSGVYVTRQPQSTITESINLMLDLEGDSVTHLADLRLSLELLGVTKAVERQDELDFGPAMAALETLRESTDEAADWVRADTVLHVEIIRLSGNPYLTSIFESVHTVLITHQYRPWIEEAVAPEWLGPEHADAQLELHEAILDAVRDRDAEAAELAVHRHHHRMADHLLKDR